jgi:hypothetical protein
MTKGPKIRNVKLISEAASPPHEGVTIVRVKGAIIHQEKNVAAVDKHSEALLDCDALAGEDGLFNVLLDMKGVSKADSDALAGFISDAASMVSDYTNGQFKILAPQGWLQELLRDDPAAIHTERDEALRSFGPRRRRKKWNHPLFCGPGY